MKQLLRKLLWQFNRRRKENEIREEIAFHLYAEVREQRDDDGIAGNRAEAQARREFGNVTLHNEDARAAWGWTWIEWLVQDARYAVRAARANPLFTLLAVASLAIGIGALLLSMTGLFSLASYSVAQRTREIGIRMALGAGRETVLGETIRDAIRPVIVGIGIGIVGSLALTPVLGSLVFGLAPYDPLALGAAALMMLAVAALAGYLPARRAAAVDPVVALRNE
jgi:hypothetical protein